nr:alpha/beta-type small acid-soluble spore protein [Alicyclobacillus macrosporangiidus]
MQQSCIHDRRVSLQIETAEYKWEIAQELGGELGPDTPSRLNGAVGGEITKPLVAFAAGHVRADGEIGRRRPWRLGLSPARRLM